MRPWLFSLPFLLLAGRALVWGFQTNQWQVWPALDWPAVADFQRLWKPGLEYYWKEIGRGVFPFWSPFEESGRPFYNIPHYGLFYPPHLFFPLLGDFWGSLTWLGSHLTLGIYFLHRLLRSFRISPFLALSLSATLFWIPSLAVWGTGRHLATFPALIWSWGCLLGWREFTRKGRREILGGSFLGLLLTGDLQLAFYVSLALGLAILFSPKKSEPFTRSRLLLFFASLVLLAAPVWLPALEYGQHWIRSLPPDPGFLRQGSWPPARLSSWWSLFWPATSGDRYPSLSWLWSVGPIAGMGLVFFVSLTLRGLARTSILSPEAFYRSGPSRRRYFLLGVFILLFLMILIIPWWSDLALFLADRGIPVLGQTRLTSRLWALVAIPGLVFFARGLSVFARSWSRKASPLVGPVLAAGIALGGLALVWWPLWPTVNSVKTHQPGPDPYELSDEFRENWPQWREQIGLSPLSRGIWLEPHRPAAPGLRLRQPFAGGYEKIPLRAYLEFLESPPDAPRLIHRKQGRLYHYSYKPLFQPETYRKTPALVRFYGLEFFLSRRPTGLTQPEILTNLREVLHKAGYSRARILRRAVPPYDYFLLRPGPEPGSSEDESGQQRFSRFAGKWVNANTLELVLPPDPAALEGMKLPIIWYPGLKLRFPGKNCPDRELKAPNPGPFVHIPTDFKKICPQMGKKRAPTGNTIHLHFFPGKILTISGLLMGLGLIYFLVPKIGFRGLRAGVFRDK